MVWQRIRFALLLGALVAVAAHPALAADENNQQNDQDQQEQKQAPKKDEAKPADDAAKFCTIRVLECVPEKFTCTRTVYKTECRTEKYTAYRCECVPEERTINCTIYKKVPCVQTVTRTHCVSVPVCEERVIQKPCYSYQRVTKMVTKCVDRGHYECREVPCHWKGLCRKVKRCCHGGCCDDCCCPPPTKVRKVWVPCMVTECVPVTCCQRVCTYTPCTVRVKCCKKELRTEQCQVCTYKCVPEVCTHKCTVMVSHKVPYEATRCVRVCVPCQEQVTCCRMVTRCVEKKVPVVDPCSPCCTHCCCSPCCSPCCCTPCCGRHHRCCH
jgi:hypothetical protein